MANSVIPAQNISDNGIYLIEAFEGLRLNAYHDAVGIPTIGYGTTHYEDGSPVKMTDRITKKRADQLLKFEAQAKAYVIKQSLDKNNIVLNQNQFDSICSFSYNVGVAGLLGSTLFRMMKLNPLDPNITRAFMMWVKGTINGKKVTLPGLVERRRREADLYFSKLFTTS